MSNAKKYIGKKSFPVDKFFQKDCIDWYRTRTGRTINPLWHNYYSAQNGIKDVRYIPENLYYSKIEPFYNRKELIKGYDDKCFYSETFSSVISSDCAERPFTYLRNISGLFYDSDFNVLTKHEAVKLLVSNKEGYVIKESLTGTGGNRIIFVEKGETKTPEELSEIFDRYKKDFVVESLVTQCDEMAYFNPSSINTIRFITFLDENGAHLLSACLRMGGKGSHTDNFSTGGIACGITEDGTLKGVAFDQSYNKHFVHPNGISFAGRKIPNYETALKLVLNLAKRFGHFRIISWDIAIAPDYKPIIIEFNLTPQSIDLHQINNGPLFGVYTEKVLHEVFKK